MRRTVFDRLGSVLLIVGLTACIACVVGFALGHAAVAVVAGIVALLGWGAGLARLGEASRSGSTPL
jgi:hypothetical protein